MLSWDCGLGKSIAAVVWPLLKLGWTRQADQLRPKGAVLIVAPGDTHQQLNNQPGSVGKIVLGPLVLEAGRDELDEAGGRVGQERGRDVADVAH